MRIVLAFLVCAVFALLIYLRSNIENPPSPTKSVSSASPSSSPLTVPTPPEPRPVAPSLTSKNRVATKPPERLAALDEAQTVFKADGPEAAAALLEKTLENHPENPELLWQLGRLYANQLKDPRRAVPLLEKAATLKPENGDTLFDLVGAYLKSNSGDRGETFLLDLIHRNPKQPNLQMAVGDFLATRGRYDDAAGHAKDAASNPEFAEEGSALAAESLAAAGRHDESTEHFARSIKLQEQSIAQDEQRGLPTGQKKKQLAETKENLAFAQMQAGSPAAAEQTIAGIPEGPNKETLMQDLQTVK